jgi:hypothetical protein
VIFWVITPSNLVRRLPMFQLNLQAPSSGQPGDDGTGSSEALITTYLIYGVIIQKIMI